jgi:hypothetical protein
MSTSGVNYLAVLVAGAAYFIIGAVWYAKPVFGKAWMEGIGRTEEQVKAAFSPWKLIWAFVGSFIAAYGIARVLSWLTAVDMSAGVVVGLIASVCFVLAAMTINDIMESRPTKLTVVNVLYHVFGFVVMGIILGAWR